MHSIAATTWGANRIDIFWLDRGFGMNHKHWDGTDWVVGWEDLGGKFTTSPAAVTLGSNRLDAFGVGSDYAMHHKSWQGNAWSPHWQNLGGSFVSAPAAIVRSVPGVAKFLDVFAVGDDHQMYHLLGSVDTFAPGISWSLWEALGGHFNSAATIIAPTPARLEVFARDRDFTLRHKSWNGTEWTLGWDNLGGVLASPPQAIALAPDRWDVFAIGTDHALWHTWWNGTFWNEWESLGGEFASAPSVASSGPNRLDIFGIGKDGALWYRWWNGFVWTDWESLGGEITSACTAVCPAANRLNVLMPVENVQSVPHDNVQRTYNIFHRSWDGTAWNPPFAESLAVPLRIPSRYHFAIDEMDPKTTRGLLNDQNYVSSSIKTGGWPVFNETRFYHDVSGPPFLVNMNFTPITVEPCEKLVFNYLIVNNGHADRATFDKAIAEIGSAIATKGVTWLVGSSAPVIGSILGAAAGKLTGMFIGIVFADCDGPVAFEQVEFSGKELQLLVTSDTHPHRVTTSHPGTDSPTLCGANSLYEVSWSIVRVH